ncbi:MAG: ATP-grasp domain-containing protein [Candidatus Nealsonbacteria bacterium]|nr:ATP-grasp domain-containing protein [Candidatus Nealsonbacteria bacterium]
MILVTDAQLRHSLAIIRSLGGKGLSVMAGDCERVSTGFFSKYAKSRVVYPDPEENEEAFLNFILQLVRRKKIEMIIPVSDKVLIPLAKHKKELEKYTVLPVGDYETIIKARDKETTLKIAQEIGFPMPKTYFVADESELEKIKEYPLIIKPRFGSGSRGIILCKNLQELKEGFRKQSRDYGPLLVQEFIPQGQEVGYYGLFGKDSQPIAWTIQKRLRSYPVSGGPSTFRETINHPEIKELAEKILKHLKWQGVAMVEFKIDQRDDQPKLMEVNPRFWGSLALSIASGIDFPYLLYCLYSGKEIPPLVQSQYRVGVKSRWLLPGDILWFFSAPKSWENFKSFFQFKGVHEDIVCRDDWKPIFGFFLASLTYLFSRKKRRFVFRKKLG